MGRQLFVCGEKLVPTTTWIWQTSWPKRVRGCETMFPQCSEVYPRRLKASYLKGRKIKGDEFTRRDGKVMTQKRVKNRRRVLMRFPFVVENSPHTRVRGYQNIYGKEKKRLISFVMGRERAAAGHKKVTYLWTFARSSKQKHNNNQIRKKLVLQ